MPVIQSEGSHECGLILERTRISMRATFNVARHAATAECGKHECSEFINLMEIASMAEWWAKTRSDVPTRPKTDHYKNKINLP